MAKNFDILLKSVRVIENGTFDSKGVNTIKFTLHYPESGVKQISTIVNMELEDNFETAYDKEWHEKMLFRQSIDSDCIISVEISQAIKRSSVEKILLKVISKLIGSGIKEIPFIGSVVSETLNANIDNYFDELANDRIIKIAEGSFPISLNMESGILPINLVCKEEVIIEQRKFDSQGNTILRTTKIPKDFCNAAVYLLIETF